METHRYYESDTIAKAYVRFCPTYNDEIMNIILENLKKRSGKNHPFDLMVDVGCGSGQATNIMAPYFKKVRASDVSLKQIEYAVSQNKFDHVTYDVGRAEEVEVKDHSVDLVLSAQSAHWFNVPKFVKEAARILKPNGCLVLMGYWNPLLTPIMSGEFRSDLTEYITSRFDHYSLFGGKYNVHCYEQLEHGFPNLHAAIRAKYKQSFEAELVYPEYSLAQIKGYMNTTDCVQNYREFEANEIRARKGHVTEEDMKAFDVTDLFGSEVKEKLGLEDASDDEVKFRAVYVNVIHVASGLLSEE